MRYVVSLSGGKASAVAAERAIARYGRGAVDLFFADTSWEDEDLYRFLDDCLARWGGDLIRHTDGRTPLQVFEDQHIIPTQRIAPCTFKLKIAPFRRWLTAQPKPLTVLLGLDWRERHRLDAPRRNYGALAGVAVDFPLLWTPLEYRPYGDVVRSWGIAEPRMYAQGFPHNNCGGRCVKQGQGEWLRLREAFPARFAEVRDWEQAQRAIGDGRADRAILRTVTGGATTPLPLADLERRAATDQLPLDLGDDNEACYCGVA